MKLKKFLALSMAAVMTLGIVGCGGNGNDTKKPVDKTEDGKKETEIKNSENTEAGGSEGLVGYTDIVLGETGTDITATIKVLTNRTDLLESDAKHPYQEYIDGFNELYPNITVDVEGITDYANETLLRLQSGDWGDIMMIPEVDKADLSTYFMAYGDLDSMKTQVNYLNNQIYENQVYGIPYMAGANGGIVYNKAVFEAAGVTELPKTPDAFLDALQKIKDYNSDIVPLYTNYAAKWTMGGQWDAAISGSATGDSTYMNQKLLHTSNPFTDPGDGTHAYNVYKVLYEAVSRGLTEEDYSTTDWEGSKGMINNGQIACMVLGSWAVPQMQDAGEHSADIAYMPFPITVNGKQFSSAGPDYCFGICTDADDTQKQASLLFVKYMTEKSGMSYNEGGLPIAASDTAMPDFYAAFSDVEFVVDEPALAGEEDLLNALNTTSELMVNQGGDDKVMSIVENASTGAKSFDDIMNEWNQLWTDAQETESVEVTGASESVEATE